MHVALICHELHKHGGHELYSYKLAESLAGRHGVHLFGMKGVDIPFGATFTRIPSAFHPSLASVLLFLPLVQRELVNHRFDIIHAQGLSALSANIVTAHTCQKARFQAISHLLSYSLRDYYHRLYFPLTSFLERKYMYNFKIGNKHIIAPSKKIKSELINCYNCKPETISVIYHGTESKKEEELVVDREQLRKQYNFGMDDFVILFVGAFWKGLDVLLSAVSILKKSDIKVLAIGGAIAQKGIRDILKKIGASFVKFVPFKMNLSEEYLLSNVLVHPSPYDGFGFVVLDALSYGLPVIVSNQAGASEIIHDKVEGIILDNWRSPAYLAESIEMLYAKRGYLKELGIAGRKLSKEYTWQRCIEETEKVYRNML